MKSPKDPIALTNQERITLIRDFPVRDIVSPPGHERVRSPDAVLKLSSSISADGGASLGGEPILLNIFPTQMEDGSLGSMTVHCVDGTHRLAAGLHADKWQTIGDIPRDMVQVWIEGWEAGDPPRPRPRWIPLHVAQASRVDWRDVSGEPHARGPTAEVSGALANDSLRIPKQHRGVRIETVLKRIAHEKSSPNDSLRSRRSSCSG